MQSADHRCFWGVLTPTRPGRKWAEFCWPNRAVTKRYPQDDGGKRARSPGRARHKPLKPLRAGMPGDSGVLVVTRVRSTTTKCTRGRGCNGHPAFPTPSQGAEDKCTTRAHRAARSRTFGIGADTVIPGRCQRVRAKRRPVGTIPE